MIESKESKVIESIKEIGLKYATAVVMPLTDAWMHSPATTKLAIFQKTPQTVVKTRKVWSKDVPYVTIGYVERVLNFVSNFQRWIKVVEKWIKIYEQKNSAWFEVEQYDAWVQCDCYIVLDWHRIERSVFGIWKMSKNKAISDWAVYESARSQATKSFADTLWIWSDKWWSEAANNKREYIQKELDVLDLSLFQKNG